MYSNFFQRLVAVALVVALLGTLTPPAGAVAPAANQGLPDIDLPTQALSLPIGSIAERGKAAPIRLAQFAAPLAMGVDLTGTSDRAINLRWVVGALFASMLVYGLYSILSSLWHWLAWRAMPDSFRGIIADVEWDLVKDDVEWKPVVDRWFAAQRQNHELNWFYDLLLLTRAMDAKPETPRWYLKMKLLSALNDLLLPKVSTELPLQIPAMVHSIEPQLSIGLTTITLEADIPRPLSQSDVLPSVLRDNGWRWVREQEEVLGETTKTRRVSAAYIPVESFALHLVRRVQSRVEKEPLPLAVKEVAASCLQQYGLFGISEIIELLQVELAHQEMFDESVLPESARHILDSLVQSLDEVVTTHHRQVTSHVAILRRLLQGQRAWSTYPFIAGLLAGTLTVNALQMPAYTRQSA